MKSHRIQAIIGRVIPVSVSVDSYQPLSDSMGQPGYTASLDSKPTVSWSQPFPSDDDSYKSIRVVNGTDIPRSLALCESSQDEFPEKVRL